MILIVSEKQALCRTAREIFYSMGYISDLAAPHEAALTLTEGHRAVLALGRDSRLPWERVIGAIRLYAGEIPLVAVREDITGGDMRLFDRVYPNSVYSSGVTAEILRLSRERGLAPIGGYRVGELDASVIGGAPKYGRIPLGLTRTETMVLRSVITRGETGADTDYILSHAFRTGRAPTEAGVRTHISAINRKLHEITDELSVTASEGGYIISRVSIMV